MKTINKNTVSKGDFIWYIDNSNCTKYQVLEITDTTITVVDKEGYYESHSLDRLQDGWELDED